MTTIIKPYSKLVQATLDLLGYCLRFVVYMTTDEAKQVLHNTMHYNAMPHNIANITDDIKRVCGSIQYGEGNPNNGKYDHITIGIGNECSLVIYIRVITTYKRSTTDNAQAIGASLQAIGTKYKADENKITQCDANSVTVRLWYD